MHAVQPNMIPVIPILLFALLVIPLGVRAAARNEVPANQAATNLPPKIISFCADKEQQVKRLATRLKLPIVDVVTSYFDAARKGDWVQAFDLFPEVKGLLSSSPEDKDRQMLEAVTYAAVLEVQLAFEQFVEGDPKYALAFGNDICRSLP